MAALRFRLKNTNPDSLENLRSLLIQTGQFEQAVFDCAADFNGKEKILNHSRAATDFAATAFYSIWKNAPDNSIAKQNRIELLGKMTEELCGIQFAAKTILNVKVPEGFEFYALFPEQYFAAALKWAKVHANKNSHQRILVIGIRSIGTTLSATVTAVLRSLDLDCFRFTVRPTGNPFSRRVELPNFHFKNFSHALVVDEGPGISGSSMAAIALALEEKSIRKISFFPGREGEPGNAASPEIRKCWNKIPRYFAPLNNISWPENCESKIFHSLRESLAARSQEICDTSKPFDIEDVSGGQWRRFAYSDEAKWPAIAAQFERMKFLCTNRNGKSVLWKFAGLGGASGSAENSAEIAFKKVSRLAEAGFAPKPLGHFRGFIATPWIDGTRLTLADSADSAVLKNIGHYIVRAAGPALDSGESRSAISRLAEMLYWNTNKLLGNLIAENTKRLAAAAMESEIPFSYGDGHLAPHEWIRVSESVILKTDNISHDADHTMVGRQSLLWDVAGALIEWNLNFQSAAPLLAPISESGISPETDALHFYQAAYAAFRAGLMSLAVQQTGDNSEKIRLRNAQEFYRNKLLILIENPIPNFA
ncbi:MAG TPA: hypothetical protein VFM25_05205 [Verrucomicrobiae bacterium]|nr:hypothetical protein [Verrucomicrobiae bacterium]